MLGVANRHGLAPEPPAQLVATATRPLTSAGSAQAAVAAAATELSVPPEIAAHLAPWPDSSSTAARYHCNRPQAGS
jgi:hypothetical protein